MSNASNRLESSRAQRLLVLLEELNLKYEIKTYKRNRDALAPEEMKNIHPLGNSPSKFLAKLHSYLLSLEPFSNIYVIILESG
jgi:hypothetical protein